jgi:opacity protein-like surface antigen
MQKKNAFLHALISQLSTAALIASGVLPHQVTAGTMGFANHPSWTWVGTLSAGPVWQNGGTTQTFYLAPGIEKTYTANKKANAAFDGEVFLGLQKSLNQVLQVQFGLAVVATSNAELFGDIWDDAAPEFSNYTYNYKIQHTHVAAKGKLLADAGFWLIPWVSGSLGVGFNDAHGFHSTPTIFEALPTPDFTSHTQTALTYTVGAGVQKALNTHWQVGVGYEFADWGKSSLGRTTEQTLNSGLGLSHLYTNGVLLNLTYLA